MRGPSGRQPRRVERRYVAGVSGSEAGVVAAGSVIAVRRSKSRQASGNSHALTTTEKIDVAMTTPNSPNGASK